LTIFWPPIDVAVCAKLVVVISAIPVRLISESARIVPFIFRPSFIGSSIADSRVQALPDLRESVFFGAAILPEAGGEGASGLGV
jgi:hypothetical protein